MSTSEPIDQLNDGNKDDTEQPSDTDRPAPRYRFMPREDELGDLFESDAGEETLSD